MTARRRLLGILQSGERNRFGELGLEQLREATVKQPVRKQEKSEGFLEALIRRNWSLMSQ